MRKLSVREARDVRALIGLLLCLSFVFRKDLKSWGKQQRVLCNAACLKHQPTQLERCELAQESGSIFGFLEEGIRFSKTFPKPTHR